ncbi:HAD family hydrolase [Candidatus Pacearchaeota archaeon]|nr:HAD family hydrolase [Candidatus Pacearchaeota archaeon]
MKKRKSIKKKIKLKPQIKLAIFDFDGTIGNTKAIYYKEIGDVLHKYGISRRKTAAAIDLGMNLKKTLGKFGFGFVNAWFLEKSIMKNVKKNASNIKKCHDVDSIKKIKTRKILVTNSLKKFVKPVLKHFKLRKEFTSVYGVEDFSDKAKFIKKYLEKHKILGDECIYVGDRVADIDVAKEAGCLSVIISGKCAWDSKTQLLKNHPNLLLENMSDLLEIID